MNESGATHVARWFKVPGLDDSCIFRDSTFSVRLQAQSRGCSKIERLNFGRASASSRLSETSRRRCVPPECPLPRLPDRKPTTDGQLGYFRCAPVLPRCQHRFARRSAPRLALRRTCEYVPALASAADGPLRRRRAPASHRMPAR